MEASTETIEAQAEVMPEPVIRTKALSPKKLAAMSAGQVAVAVLKETGQELTADEEQEVLAISDAALMDMFVEAKLDDSVKPDKLLAQSVFSGALFKRIKVEDVLLVHHFQTIGETARAVQFCKDEVTRKREEDNPLTPEQHAAFLKTLIYSLSEQSMILTRAHKLAKEMGPHEPAKRKPKNRAPDTLLIQNNGTCNISPSSDSH